MLAEGEAGDDDADNDPRDRLGEMTFLRSRRQGPIVTGVLYVDPEAEDLHAHLDTVSAAQHAGAKALCPGSAALDKINASLR